MTSITETKNFHNFITYLQSRKKSENTLKIYTRNIKNFFEYIDKEETEVDSFDIMNWMESMSDHASASVAQAISSVKAYFKFLKAFQIISVNPAAEIEPPTVKNKPKHYMDAQMIKDMIAHCKNSRDKAIILTYATTGLRVSELTGLTLDQYEEMKMNGDNMIKIVGKGSKERFIPFNAETQRAIDDYLRCRYDYGTGCNKLFLSFQGNEIARNNLSTTLKRIAKNAGIPFWNEICNHQMRAACASIYDENGTDVTVIRDLLGHSNIATTSRYIKLSTQRVNKAVMDMSFT